MIEVNNFAISVYIIHTIKNQNQTKPKKTLVLKYLHSTSQDQFTPFFFLMKYKHTPALWFYLHNCNISKSSENWMISDRHKGKMDSKMWVAKKITTSPVLVPIEFIVVCSRSGYPLITCMLKFVILNTKLKMNINSK